MYVDYLFTLQGKVHDWDSTTEIEVAGILPGTGFSLRQGSGTTANHKTPQDTEHLQKRS